MKPFLLFSLLLGPLVLLAQTQQIPTDGQYSPAAWNKGCCMKQVVEGGHFQGIQRWQQDSLDFLWLSASSDSFASLVRINLQAEEEPWLYHLDTLPMKHAGGFQICGNWLAVGIEDNEARTRSDVVGYRIYEDGSLAEEAGFAIEREGPYERTTAGAVGMVWHALHHWVLVGSWDCRSIDVYRTSQVSTPNDTLLEFELYGSFVGSADEEGQEPFPNYQNLQLYEDEDQNLWLGGMFRNGKLNQLDWYQVDLPRQASLKEQSMRELLNLIAEHPFPSRKVHFQAGGGIFVSPQGEVEVMGVAHKRPRYVIWGPN